MYKLRPNLPLICRHAVPFHHTYATCFFVKTLPCNGWITAGYLSLRTGALSNVAGGWLLCSTCVAMWVWTNCYHFITSTFTELNSTFASNILLGQFGKKFHTLYFLSVLPQQLVLGHPFLILVEKCKFTLIMADLQLSSGMRKALLSLSQTFGFALHTWGSFPLSSHTKRL